MTFEIVTEAERFNTGPKRMTHRIDATVQWAAIEAAHVRHRHHVTPSACPGITVTSCEVVG